MSQVITNAFEQYWQSSLAAEQPVVLDEFILADIPNLDITAPIDPDTVLPPESQIVHRQNVDQRGRINNNAVAYTIVMDTTVGDFSFNAMYLRNKQNGVIGMIVYKGRETKLKTDQTTGQTGNSLVKSMLMGYDQAAEATLTNVDAGTWQIDYAARLRGQDEDLRQLASQLYGHHTFIGDGFKVVQQDGGHQVTQGVAIVGGLRIDMKQPEVIHPGTKPIGVWVDVHRSGSLLSEHQNHFTIITSVADLTDHVDGNGYQHYVAKLATVQADSTVIDGRGQGGSGGSGAIPDTFALWKRSMAEVGYDLVGQFGTKLTIQNAKQVLLSKEGTKAYAWQGELPKDVPADATLENTGGFGPGLWLDKSDASLRKNVASPDGGRLIGIQQPFAGAVHRTLHDKNAEMLSPTDFLTLSEAISAAITNDTQLFNNDYTFIFTVGAGGTFGSIKRAIKAACKLRPTWQDGHDFCEIKLKSGFVLSEHFEFGAGVDLSWIKITSEDAVVYSDTTNFTEVARTYYSHKYLFYFKDGAKSPLFAIQLEESRNDSDVCAFLATQSAELNFLPYSGARKFYVGIHGSFGAKVRAYHTGCAPDAISVATYMPPGYYVCDFSYSRYSSLQMNNGVVVQMPLSKFEHCTEFNQPSVGCIYNVDADFQGSSASHCYIGWNARDGSRMNIRDHKTIHCTYRGLTCIHTAYVDARRHDTEEFDAATSGRVLDPSTENGFYGCALGVRIDGAGCVDVAGNDMRNCGTVINADTGATVSGKAVDISNSTIGFDCHAGAIIAFPRLWGTDVKKLMHLQDGCKFNSNICHVYGSTPTTDIRWVDNERSEVTFMNALIDANSGLMNDCGSRMTIESSTTKVQSIRSFFGSNVAVNDTKADKEYSVAAGVAQAIISGGSFISATGYTNLDGTPLKLSVPRNTLSIAGAIFSIDGAP
ncbi:phage tail protein [Aeromonas media]|uniref:phage tail-collar fiber domain-containing protein n=1 Tax=Aeromonas media TaxID=651 RepID=UPI00384CF468